MKLEKDKNFEGSDVREGLTVILSLKVPEDLLQFEGQTKGKLGTPEARSITESITYDSLKFYLEENKEVALNILEKAMKSKTAREAARKAREEARNGKNKSKIEKNLSGKLAPAQSKNPKINETKTLTPDNIVIISSINFFVDDDTFIITVWLSKALNT